MQVMFLSHRKHSYGLPRPVTGIGFMFMGEAIVPNLDTSSAFISKIEESYKIL
jgi:hypothetical protein